MFNDYSNEVRMKVNSSVSGTLVKKYKKSFFTSFDLSSVKAEKLFSESPKMKKSSMNCDMPVVVIQCMLAGGKSNTNVIAEVMWKEDFDKMFENGEEETDWRMERNVKTLSRMYEELSDKEVAEHHALQEYKKIGTVEEYRDAIEMQRKNKPNLWGDGVGDNGEIIYDMYDCPNCGKSYEIDYEKYKYCPECGQAIDWEMEYEKGEPK